MDEFSVDDELLFRVHGAIERCGVFVMAVMSTPTSPSWAYTIGLLERGHPELVTVGLSAESAHGFLMHACAELITGVPLKVGRARRRIWPTDDGVDLHISFVEVPTAPRRGTLGARISGLHLWPRLRPLETLKLAQQPSCSTRATLSDMATQITQRELRNDSGAIMRRLEAGERFLVTRNGVPVGELTPLRRRQFVATDVALAAFEGAPAVEGRRLRDDLDRFVDDDVTPRA
ncbi:MAG: DUF4262 domain-containing protein [Acidimicrobiia bacterium]|nr:DUF4262 domain-containing protein [Acidimicrobiia bacterium]